MSNSEYISRDAVDNVLLELEERIINNPFALTAMAMAIDKIDNIPPADVAPVGHGRWIYGEDESGQDGYSCSECDFFVPWYYKYYEQGLHFIKDYHLCPQCGAKMDEEVE